MRANDGTGQRGHVTPKHVFASGDLPARSVLEWLPAERVTPRE